MGCVRTEVIERTFEPSTLETPPRCQESSPATSGKRIRKLMVTPKTWISRIRLRPCECVFFVFFSLPKLTRKTPLCPGCAYSMLFHPSLVAGLYSWHSITSRIPFHVFRISLGVSVRTDFTSIFVNNCGFSSESRRLRWKS